MSSRILVVDDDVTFTGLVKSRLEHSGYEVMTAADGLEAFQMTKDTSPDLIVLDMIMPKMSGYEFVKALRKEKEKIGNTPVVVISSKRGMQQFFEPWEIEGFLPKPFEAPQLLSAIEQILAGKKAVSPVVAPTPAAPSSAPAASSGNVAILIGVEDYVVRKVKNHLESRGIEVRMALSEAETVELAITLKPSLVLAQLWENVETLDAFSIRRKLQAGAETKNTLFAIFCSSSLAMDAMKEMPMSQVLGYVNSDDLLERLDDFTRKHIRPKS